MSKRANDEGWVEVQKHTFTRWANVFLPPEMAVDDLYEDLKDGLRLIALLERISNKPVAAKYNRVVKYRIHMLENLNLIFGFMAKENVTVTNIGSSDIVDCNSKLVLGLMWTIIKHYQLADISVHGVTGKEGLLLWCKESLEAFPDIVSITNFTSSWSNGLAFCALIHAFHPTLVDLDSLSPARPVENLTLAFTLLEATFDVPPLLQVEDFEVGVDEKSVLTYLALVFRVFGVLERPKIVRTPSFREPDVATDATDDDAPDEDDSNDAPDVTDDEAPVIDEVVAEEDSVKNVLIKEVSIDAAPIGEAPIGEAPVKDAPIEEAAFEEVVASDGPTEPATVASVADALGGDCKGSAATPVAVSPTRRFWFLRASGPGTLVVLSFLPRARWLRCCVALYAPVGRLCGLPLPIDRGLPVRPAASATTSA
ncbi:alpha-actinin-1 [Achlya hypogyna]|uniref:Alpha-actinin-1 n=1 Tax=Achlya hypogyna TaxID=1202772 RepID=A0A1V9Z2Z4_ACHHY|nr:alpha-actinin-1 [Achlya hypogyna]